MLTRGTDRVVYKKISYHSSLGLNLIAAAFRLATTDDDHSWSDDSLIGWSWEEKLTEVISRIWKRTLE